MAGIGFVLLIDALFRHDRVQVMQIIAMGFCWIISFFFVYMISYRSVVDGTNLASFMNTYWDEKFLRLDITSIMRALFEPFIWMAGLFQPMLLILTIYGAIIGIYRMNKIGLALLLLPVLFMFIASLLELYPIDNRMILFFIPNLMLLASIGWWHTIADIRSKYPHIAWLLVAILLGIILIRIQLPLITVDTTEAREALGWVHEVKEDEPLYISGRISAIARYYGYEFQLWDKTLASNQSYWLVTTEQDGIVPTNPIYHSYTFRNTLVFCVPIDEKDCPDSRS